MAEGGLFDHLGGGFYRCSVDAHWGIPHFEKVLYDNGQLLALYADAWGLSGAPFFRRVAEMTAAWVLREMRSPQGGFYSALDADSQGEEGRYYLWSRDEARALLDDDEYAALAQAYGLAGAPNFEGHLWHLRLGGDFLATPEVERGREKLLAARGKRVRPGCDDKILAGWSGLMIAGLLRVARRLDCAEWLAAGQGALDFVRSTFWRNGRLLATSQEGRGRGGVASSGHDHRRSSLRRSGRA